MAMQRTAFVLGIAALGSAFLGSLGFSAPRSADAEPESEFAGVFRDATLRIEFRVRAAGSLDGTIRLGASSFPASAQADGSKLSGHFTHEGTRFEFTAVLEGDILTLTSGGTTYRLEREKAAVATTPPTQAAPPPHAVGALRFKRFAVRDRDDMIGGEAVSFLAPASWRLEGGIAWRPHPVMPASLATLIRDPEGPTQFEVFPALPFSWGGSTGPGTPFPEGSNYLGNEVRPPVSDAARCIRDVVLPRFRRGIRLRIAKEEALPKLAAEVKAQNPPQPGIEVEVTAARARVEYQLDGKAVEEDISCALILTRIPRVGMTIWLADRLTARRAEKGRLEAAEPIFETIQRSAKIELAWFNKYAQLVDALTKAQMQQIKNAGEFSKILSRTSNEISEGMRRSWEERQASEERIQRNFSRYVRGVDEYQDPGAGTRVELPSGYDGAWVNARGEYIITESPSFNPNVELEGNWRKLEKTEGAGPSP